MKSRVYLETLHDSKTKRNGHSDFVIAGLGDSLTQGWMVRLGFFDLFINSLKDRFPNIPIRGLNAGVPGDTAFGGLNRLNIVLSHRPTLLLVQFGINDMYCGVNLSDFENSINNIVKVSKSAGSHPILVTSCPLANPSDQAEITRYYDVIRRLCEKEETVLIDIDEYWRSLSPITPLLLSDGVHPSDQGHELMSEALLAAFPD